MRRFFDTNVLVYLFDDSQPRKKRQAQGILTQAVGNGTALISTQVLQEFFVTVTRNLSSPMALDDAERAVRDLAQLRLVDIDSNLILRAIATMARYRLSFWDSLIVRAALHGGATILYTEDLSHGQVIETLAIENPFLTS